MTRPATKFTASGVRDIARSELFQCPTGCCNVCGDSESRCPQLALRAYAEVLEAQEKQTQPTDVVETEVLRVGEYQESSVGRGYRPLLPADGKISQTRAKALLAYATKRALEADLAPIVSGWKVVVCADDSGGKLDGRTYSVQWTSPVGTTITLHGILVHNGRPCGVDHRFAVEEPA